MVIGIPMGEENGDCPWEKNIISGLLSLLLSIYLSIYLSLRTPNLPRNENYSSSRKFGGMEGPYSAEIQHAKLHQEPPPIPPRTSSPMSCLE